MDLLATIPTMAAASSTEDLVAAPAARARASAIPTGRGNQQTWYVVVQRRDGGSVIPPPWGE